MMRLILVAALLLLAACIPELRPGDVDAGSADGGTGTSETGNGNNSGSEVTFCGGGATTGPYVETVMTHECVADVEVRSVLTMYQCRGCDGPLLCDECEDPPEHYIQMSLAQWETDLSGETLTQQIYTAFRCDVSGGCEEAVELAVEVDEHVPGECMRGTYRFRFPGNVVAEGEFDAGSVGPPPQKKIDDCG